MTDLSIGASFVGLLAALILLRVPVSIALIGVSFVGLWLLAGLPVAWGAVGLIPYQSSASWILSSVPAFLFMGYLCSNTGLTQGLFDAARKWLSFLPGGLAIASVFGCAGFSAMSGSSVACSAAMGRITVPEMVRNGYQPEMATSTVAAAGTLGPLIPPSILMIVYGVLAKVSISALFVGGAIIGVISAFVYICVIIIRVKLQPELAPSTNERYTFGEKLYALSETWPMLLIMFGVLGGLFGGVFTPTEAGAIGAALSVVVALLKGRLTTRLLMRSAVEAGKTTAMIILIVIGASLFTRFLAISGSGALIRDAVLSFGLDQNMILLALIMLFLFLGLFLEPMGAMLLTMPIVLPILGDANINLIWFGVLLTKLLEVGCLTPPFGMNVFVMKSVVGNMLSIGTIFRGVTYFIAGDLVLIVLMFATRTLMPV